MEKQNQIKEILLNYFSINPSPTQEEYENYLYSFIDSTYAVDKIAEIPFRFSISDEIHEGIMEYLQMRKSPTNPEKLFTAAFTHFNRFFKHESKKFDGSVYFSRLLQGLEFFSFEPYTFKLEDISFDLRMSSENLREIDAFLNRIISKLDPFQLDEIFSLEAFNNYGTGGKYAYLENEIHFRVTGDFSRDRKIDHKMFCLISNLLIDLHYHKKISILLEKEEKYRILMDKL